MKRNQIIKIIIGVAVVAVTLNLLLRSCQSSAPQSYLQDASDNITFEQAAESFKKIEFNNPDTAREYFSRGAVNQHTVRFFKHLQMQFKEYETVEAHLEAVKQYLYSIMDQYDADRLFAIYKKFVEYESDLAKMMQKWDMPKNADEALAFMSKVRDFRNMSFGNDIADAMFSYEFKIQEYQIRRSSITEDTSLYANQKTELLTNLNKDMWGVESDGTDAISRPYDQYQERLQLYSKDMSDLPPEKRVEMDKKFRDEIFSPDVVKEFERIDNMLENEKKQETAYRAEEQKITRDINLTPGEKQAKINELQNQLFGEEADAFRRREIILEAEKRMSR